jgi:hypothetical protein
VYYPPSIFMYLWKSNDKCVCVLVLERGEKMCVQKIQLIIIYSFDFVEEESKLYLRSRRTSLRTKRLENVGLMTLTKHYWNGLRCRGMHRWWHNRCSVRERRQWVTKTLKRQCPWNR